MALHAARVGGSTDGVGGILPELIGGKCHLIWGLVAACFQVVTQPRLVICAKLKTNKKGSNLVAFGNKHEHIRLT